MRYSAKLIIPKNDEEDIHLRDTESNDIEVHDGWKARSKLPALCGCKVAGTQSILTKVNKSRVCSECLELAQLEGIDLDKVLRLD